MRSFDRTTVFAITSLVAAFVACGDSRDGASSDDAGSMDAGGGDANVASDDAAAAADRGGPVADGATSDVSAPDVETTDAATDADAGAIEDGATDDGGDAAPDAALDAGPDAADAGTRTVTLAFYDPSGRLLGEYDELGAPKVEIAYLGATPIAAVYPDATYVVHTDQVGAPRALVDANNETKWRWDADPFGAAPANEDADADGVLVTFPMRLRGQRADEETGLFYNAFRDYDPSVGRYVQADPLGLVGGMNAYVFVDSDPLRFVDVFGLQSSATIPPAKRTVCQWVRYFEEEAKKGGLLPAYELSDLYRDQHDPTFSNKDLTDASHFLYTRDVLAPQRGPIMTAAMGYTYSGLKYLYNYAQSPLVREIAGAIVKGAGTGGEPSLWTPSEVEWMNKGIEAAFRRSSDPCKNCND